MADDAQAREAGVWSTDADYQDLNLRKVCYPGDMEYSPSKLVEISKGQEAPLRAILEYVFSSSYVTMYLYKLKTVIKLHMTHLYSPNSKEEPELYEQGKTFVARKLLHRTVGVKLNRVDDRNELVGRIYFT